MFSATSLVVAVAVARHATPTQFGAFAVAYVAYTILLGTVEAFTIEVVMVRGAKASPVGLRRMLGNASGTAVCAGLACTVAGALVAGVAYDASSLAVAMLLPAPLLFLQDVWRLAFLASGRPRAAVANDLTWAALLAVGLAIGPTFGTDQATSIVWVWSGAGAVCGVMAAVQGRCRPRLGAAIRWSREHGPAGGRYAGEFLAIYGAGQGVLISVGLFAGLADSGGYRGAQLLFGPVQVALNAMRIGAIPLLARARARGSGDAVWKRGLMAGGAAGVVALAWGTAALALPNNLGRQLLGSTWTSAHSMLLPLLCALVANAFGLGALLILRSAEALQSTFNVRVAGALVVFALGTAGAWVGGGVAASSGVAVGATLLTAGLWWEARRVRYTPIVPAARENR